MPQGDQTGPKGEGPETGRGLGKVVGNDSGQYTDEGRLGRGYGLGPGKDNTRTYKRRPLESSETGLEKKITGPGGHTPDATGPHGMGNGPGGGKGDGSGFEKITNIEKYFIPNDKTYNSVSKEYNSIYSQYQKNYSSSSSLKRTILGFHNEAVKKGYKGNKRKTYVRNKMREYSKKNSKKSSGKTYNSKKTSTKKVA